MVMRPEDWQHIRLCRLRGKYYWMSWAERRRSFRAEYPMWWERKRRPRLWGLLVVESEAR